MPAEYRVLDWRRGGDAPNAAPRARLAGQLAGTRPRSIERALVYGRRGLDRAISLAENWTGETEVQNKFLHLFGDFSQPAISGDMSGNSADISKRYFQNCTASSSPIWSASKSLILQR